MHDRGYSNWTVEETTVHCALDRNRFLLDEHKLLPYDWFRNNEDNWPATNQSRCEQYRPLADKAAHVHLDVDHENDVRDFDLGVEVTKAIEQHSGRKPR